MKCSDCGFVNAEDMLYCGKCGAVLPPPPVPDRLEAATTISCHNCHSAMPANARFCGICGTSLVAAPPVPAVSFPTLKPAAAVIVPALPSPKAVAENPPPEPDPVPVASHSAAPPTESVSHAVTESAEIAPGDSESDHAPPQPPATPALHPHVHADTPAGSLREMVLVSQGWFAMGSRKDEGRPDEHPRHQVELSAFFIDRCAVSNLEYEQFDPSHRRLRSHVSEEDSDPVVFVSYQDCLNYCRWRAQREGVPVDRYRLPTEAQWERCCRAGGDEVYPWGEGPVPDGINTQESNRGRTAAVDQGTPNAFGLYHLGSNLREWCLDYYVDNYYTVSPPRDPPGPAPRMTVNMIVVRGASFQDSGQESGRSAARNFAHPSSSASDLGFRCVRVVK